jgi:glycine/D-amino acid oxidase-like deaminating enzyme
MHVVVIGGGLIGHATDRHLVYEGAAVTLVEARDTGLEPTDVGVVSELIGEMVGPIRPLPPRRRLRAPERHPGAHRGAAGTGVMHIRARPTRSTASPDDVHLRNREEVNSSERKH